MGSHMRPEITSGAEQKRQAKEEIEEIAYRCEEDFENKHKKLKLKQKKQYILYKAKVIRQNEKKKDKTSKKYTTTQNRNETKKRSNRRRASKIQRNLEMDK